MTTWSCRPCFKPDLDLNKLASPKAIGFNINIAVEVEYGDEKDNEHLLATSIISCTLFKVSDNIIGGVPSLGINQALQMACRINALWDVV